MSKENSPLRLKSANEDKMDFRLTHEQRKLLLKCVDRYRLLNVIPDQEQQILKEIRSYLNDQILSR